MTDLSSAQSLRRAGTWVNAFDHVVLSYDERFLRRKRLVTGSKQGFLVSLDEPISVVNGDGFELDDGRIIEVIAATEPVLVITGELARLAWHIGNRHTPCQIEPGRPLIRQDHVLQAMLQQMGAHMLTGWNPSPPKAALKATTAPWATATAIMIIRRCHF